jgi:hypothetical protein
VTWHGMYAVPYHSTAAAPVNLSVCLSFFLSVCVDCQIISGDPDITVTQLLPSDRFAVIACDGIWDCFDNQAVVSGSAGDRCSGRYSGRDSGSGAFYLLLSPNCFHT